MKKLFLLFTMCAVMFTACENEGGENYTSALIPTTRNVKFSKSGGEQIIKFTIQNPVGGKVTVEENAEWLDAIVEMNSELKITAEANEGEAREAIITLKYTGAKDVEFTVTQKAGNSSDYDVEFEARHFEGTYFGKESSNNYNYFVIISDTGATMKGEVKSNGTYYFFDFYSTVAGNEDAPVLPNGTYTFDANDTFGNLTFSDAGSWFQVQEDGKTVSAASYKSATAIVKNGSFEAIIELTNGQIHHVTYEGDLTVASDNIYSTFTEDFNFSIDGAKITATNYGDTQQMGLQSWFIEAVKGDDLFMLEFFSADSSSPAGVYTAFTEGQFEKKFIPGFINNGLVGTWYAKLTNGTIKGDVMAPIVDGLVRVTVNGNTATIEYSAYDDAGNEIAGSISGSYTKAEPEQ